MTARPNSTENAPQHAAPPAGGVSAPDDQDMVVIRERRKKKKRKRTSRKKRGVPTAVKVIVGIVAALAIVAGSAYAFLQYNISKGDEQLHAPEVEDTAKTITYKGHTYRYNDNVVALLVMGKDDESSYGTDRSCTDANMLATLDTEEKVLTVVAIPRDSMVDVDLFQDGAYTRTALTQLAVAYGVDVASEDESARNSMKSVAQLFYNLPVERYFVLEMDAVGQLASAVGGVKVEALDTYPGAAFAPGDTVMLEGDAALMYVKYRDINVDKSAQDRQKRQMQFVKAFLEKLHALDVGSIMDLYNTVKTSTFTNLDVSDISYLASVYVGGKSASTQYVSLTGETKLEPDDDGIEREHVYLDEDSVMEATLAAFYTQVD